ncbi:MAG: DNA polymerase III subunit delta [Deltaproteobacteria bacterium]|nr:DNA polymerase III subunit delta [Deltaproteobacteria bacterium]
MQPEQAIREANGGKLRPVYVVTGPEQLLGDRVVAAIRRATTTGSPTAAFNEERFVAAETSAEKVVAAARTVPMMASHRFVAVRGVERWEAKDEGKEGGRQALDALADYAASPSPTTVLVVVATALHGSRRLVTGAKEGGYLVECDALGRRELPAWIRAEAAERGRGLGPGMAELLAELVGPELGPVSDALERLSLYVGPGAPIAEEAVARVVTRVRQSTVWQLVDALGRRQLGPALGALADAFDQRDGGLRLLGAVRSGVAQLIKLDAALRRGVAPADAAKAARVPPFRAQQAAQTVRGCGPGQLERWLVLLATADRELKSSRRSALAVLEATVVAMCRSGS